MHIHAQAKTHAYMRVQANTHTCMYRQSLTHMHAQACTDEQTLHTVESRRQHRREPVGVKDGKRKSI